MRERSIFYSEHFDFNCFRIFPASANIVVAESVEMNSVATNNEGPPKKRRKIEITQPKVNDVVMAKMRCYCPWPARVDNFNGNRVDIYFFGTYQTGTVNIKDIKLYSESRSQIRQLIVRRNPLFHRAVLEVEALMNIPMEYSVFNREIGFN